MKLGNYIFVCLLLVGISLKTNASNSIFENANKAYQEEDYFTALNLYTKLVDSLGFQSENLFFNLGNTHYKLGNVGQSVLYFEKALKLNPNNKNTHQNLSLAQSKMVDYSESLPPIFLTVWWRNVAYFKTHNEWAIFASVFIWLAIICFIVFRVIKKPMALKSIGYVLLIGFAMSLFFSFYIYRNINSKQFAVVISTSTQVKTAPDKKSTNLFKLYEGYKVKVTDILGEWTQISHEDGKKGWIQTAHIEAI